MGSFTNVKVKDVIMKYANYTESDFIEKNGGQVVCRCVHPEKHTHGDADPSLMVGGITGYTYVPSMQ